MTKGIITIFFTITLGLTLYSQDNIQNSIVKIFTTKQANDLNEPWNSGRIQRSTATGFIIEGNRIITNAHAVANYRYLQVRFGNNPRKIDVKIEFISDDYDLAILKFTDNSELPKLKPLEFGNSLKLKEKVVVYGYPIGGDRLSITEGIISRIQLRKYVFSQKTYSTIQTDAATNPGNSGGPVFVGNKVIGIHFQGTRNANNIGHTIPSHIIQHFLDDIKDNKYDGIPSLELKWTPLESNIHRKMLGMKDNETGVLVKSVNKYSNIKKIIEKNDVILKLDNELLGIDGSINFNEGERIGFNYLLEHKKYGDYIEIELLRNKKKLTKRIKLEKPNRNPVIVSYKSKSIPSYYITSGFVFQKLSINYLNQFTKSRRNLKDKPYDLINFIKNPPDNIDEIIFLTSVLPDVSNEGYQHLKNIAIAEVNNEKVVNMRDFISKINKERYATLKDINGNIIVIDNNISKERNPKIKEIYNISSLQSKDLD